MFKKQASTHFTVPLTLPVPAQVNVNIIYVCVDFFMVKYSIFHRKSQKDHYLDAKSLQNDSDYKYLLRYFRQK